MLLTVLCHKNNTDKTQKLLQLKSWEARYGFSWPLLWKDTSGRCSIVHTFVSLSSNFLLKSLSVDNHNINWSVNWIWDRTRVSETLNLQLKIRSRKEKKYVGGGAKGEAIQVLRKKKKNCLILLTAETLQNSKTFQLGVSKL